MANATTKFQYDGFGNLVSKTLNGTTSAIAVNAATNRLTNATYDANGNMTSGAGLTMTYDVANRVTMAQPASGGSEAYSYGPDNKRIYRARSDGTEEWTLWGAHGERHGTFNIATYYTGDEEFNYYYVVVNPTLTFAGKELWEQRDRVGTSRLYNGRFYPYGEEITSTPGDRTKFATYNRSSMTGLDYADQRYYASTYGRFNTPDPMKSSAVPNDPGSWNRYAYVGGDPVNSNDPTGLLAQAATQLPGDDPGMLEQVVCPDPNDLDPVFGIESFANSYCIIGSAVKVALPEMVAPTPKCPLIGIIGSYTVTQAWPVYAEFAPQMAYDLDEAIATLNNEGIVPQINSGYRSIASQGNIPSNNPNRVAAPGMSWHNVGDAVDIQLNPATQMGQQIIAAMEGAGLTWGGTWTKADNVHFQLPPDVYHSNGTVTSGAPSPSQVANCQAEHPLGH